MSQTEHKQFTLYMNVCKKTAEKHSVTVWMMFVNGCRDTNITQTFANVTQTFANSHEQQKNVQRLFVNVCMDTNSKQTFANVTQTFANSHTQQKNVQRLFG